MTTGPQSGVRVESMRLLLKQVPIALTVNLAIVTLFVLVLMQLEPRAPLAWWWLGMFLLISVRLLLWWRWSKTSPPSPASLKAWERRVLLGSILSGALWGGGAVFLFPEQAFYQIFVAFVVGGMAAGAAVGMAYSLPAYFGFVLPSVLPLAARFVMEGSFDHFAMAGLVLIYALALSLFARNQHTVLTRALDLQITKGRLASELKDLLRDVEKRVDERTEELRLANRKLTREIAERQRAERAERRARSAAERASKAKSLFLAAASHDLRQPFQGLRLHLDVLRRDLSTAQQRELASRMSSILDSTRELLNTLMDLSALESARIEPAFQSFRPRDLIDHIAAEARMLAQRKGLELRLHPCSSSVRARTDPVLLSRMVRNLVSNAVRHTDRGAILVACRSRQRHVCVQVWDTGPGIPEDKLSEIFDAFYSRETLGEGLGLGLWIVARTARILDHEVRVKSKPGRGSVFCIQMARVA